MDSGGPTLIVPYGSAAQICRLTPGRKVTVLEARGPAGSGAAPDEAALIGAAMDRPIGSPPLSEIARGKKKVVILTSDHTRPVPSRLTIPPLLSAIRKGSPEADVTILIGVGCHRSSTAEEIERKFGSALAARERILNHDPRDASGLVSLGSLPSGGELVISRAAAEADLLVADGFIEPHQFAGFSGGRKSVLPGVAALETVLASHNAEFTVHPKARPGSLDGNPFQTDMVFAARAAKLAFILNVTLDSSKRVEAAFAGDLEAAHLAGCEHVLERCAVKAAPAPIVVTSNGGYPLDQNIYQATKSIMAADLTCADSGVIVAVNECRDGHGSESFLRAFRQAASLESLLGEIEARGRSGTIADQWVIQLTASILVRRKVVMVTEASREHLKDLGIVWSPDLESAMRLAEEMAGDPMAPVTVLPAAVSVVIR